MKTLQTSLLVGSVCFAALVAACGPATPPAVGPETNPSATPSASASEAPTTAPSATASTAPTTPPDKDANTAPVGTSKDVKPPAVPNQPIQASALLAEVSKLGFDMKKIPNLEAMPL